MWSKLGSLLRSSEPIGGALRSSMSAFGSKPLVSESLKYAKGVVNATSLKGWGGVGAFAGYGAVAGVGYDYGMNNGRSPISSALKGAALGGLGRMAYGGIGAARSGFGDLKSAYSAGASRAKDTIIANGLKQDAYNAFRKGPALAAKPQYDSVFKSFLG